MVPPNHFRLAIFSYTRPTELADEDMAAEVAMMDEERRVCRFAEHWANDWPNRPPQQCGFARRARIRSTRKQNPFDWID